ncbi:DNA (cytosine-5)-methyltransferase 1 [Runella defluvii]|uniref:DNA (cytosine-5-)-methyltransferase n=1 Tax=Runella defluvii TaxID=370973 RepID=A0A7W5ZNM9_9BACT|nr:DNA cytosine methyltransferase [Runella defluvii]MBB3840740.1 DNA (cytosine-5)-methyltransferase 1 [Runella defluvii]
MTHAGYFEGIGGFSLAAESVGIKTIYTCELDDFRTAWLTYRFKNAIHERDIRTAVGHYATIFTGGFPCQDISLANPNGKGLEGNRSGLWWEFYRLICIHRPKYVVLENSPNLVNLGLLDILRAFAQIGYNAEWEVISKRAVGYSDERERIFVVAYPNEIRRYHHRQVFDRKYYEMCLKEIQQKKFFQSQTFRVPSMEFLRQALTVSIQEDTGLSNRVAKAEIEAYGDAVNPKVAALVLKMIQYFDQSTNQYPCKQNDSLQQKPNCPKTNG